MALFASLSGMALPVLAQGYVGGIAVDAESGAPLRCLDVALEDTTARVVGRQRTDAFGVFQFPAPEDGVYRIRFAMAGAPPVLTQPQSLRHDVEQAVRYRVAFGLDDDPGSGDRDWLFEGGSNPQPRLRSFGNGPRYPREHQDPPLDGDVRVRFVVGADGRVDTSSLQIVSSTSPHFAESVRRFAPRMRFTPALRDGRPVCALFQMRMSFVNSAGSRD